jgi:hypothetical protein
MAIHPEDYYDTTSGLNVCLKHPDQMEYFDLMRCAVAFAEHGFKFYPIGTIKSNIECRQRALAAPPTKKPPLGRVCQSQQGILVDPEDEDGIISPSLGRLCQSRRLVVDDSEDEGGSQDPPSTPTRPHPRKPTLMLPHPNRPSQTLPTSTPMATHTPSQTLATSNPTTAVQVLTHEEDSLQTEPPTPSKRPRKSTPPLPKPDTPQMLPKPPKSEIPPPLSALVVEAGPRRGRSAGNNKRKAEDQSTRASKRRRT